MFRYCLLAGALALACPPAKAATASIYTDLHGKACKTIEFDPQTRISTRRCVGVGGYSLLVHEANAQTSIDIVTPERAVLPLEYWEVVTPGLSHVGRKAEWRVTVRNGKLVPQALLVRLNTGNEELQGPRLSPGAIITAARIARDGACVVYQGDAAARGADDKARAAALDPRRKCLGVFADQ